MPAFLDVEQITLRSGPLAHRFGDPWNGVCQGKVEHDRFVYLYASTGAGTSEYLDEAGISSTTEMREMIEAIRAEAPRYGWKGVRWKRIKDGREKMCVFKFREAA